MLDQQGAEHQLGHDANRRLLQQRLAAATTIAVAAPGDTQHPGYHCCRNLRCVCLTGATRLLPKAKLALAAWHVIAAKQPLPGARSWPRPAAGCVAPCRYRPQEGSLGLVV